MTYNKLYRVITFLCLSFTYATWAHAQETQHLSVAQSAATLTDDAAGTNKTEISESEEDPGIATAAQQMILIDASTNTVLAQKNASQSMFPSSMTKLMTLYVLFERLKEGSVKLTDKFTVSEKAWRMQGSKMYVPIGTEVVLEDLIRGIHVQSGNDACIVVAEGLAGSEEQFAVLMNEKAKALGMNHTHFVNATGWPDENHYTTAMDLAILGARIIQDFPEYHHYSSEPEFTFNNIRQGNRNLLLSRKDLGVDGLKTGHTEIAGYGIVLSANEPGGTRRLILVINGLKDIKARAEEGAKLLTYGFKQFQNVTLAKTTDTVLEAPVWMGKQAKVPLAVKNDVVITVGRLKHDGISAKAIVNEPIASPVTIGQEVGTYEVTLANGEKKSTPLVTAQAVERKGALARIPFVIGHWLGLN